MLSHKNGRNLFFVKTFILVTCLVFSSSLPLAHTQTSGGFTLPCTINTIGNAWAGEIAFGLFQTSLANGPTGSYLVVMNTNGNLEYLRQTNAADISDQSYEVVKNIAPDTLMFTGEPYLGGANTAPLFPVHIWNYVTNTTEDFPNVIGHHDIEYDPVNNTFLTLQDYVITVNGNPTLFDKIVEFNATGSILWSWDTYNLPLSEADPYNLTSIINGTTVVDFTHANALYWDYNNSVVYLNVRNLNTFYKIDQNTGNIIWACGQFGNFTLLGANGAPVTSLWYHSHATTEVAPDVFAMFDNDFDNVTNPDDCHSQLLEVTLNETSMTASVSWSWTAPTSYWSEYWGDTVRLPNGDRMGVFGTQTHQFAQNQPYTTSDTGAIIVEVNPQGQVVRTYTFPVGWGIYRVIPLTYPSSVVPPPSPTPTPSPTSTSTQTSSPSPTSSPTSTPSPTPTSTPTGSLNPVAPEFSNKTLTTGIIASFLIVITVLALIKRSFKERVHDIPKQ